VDRRTFIAHGLAVILGAGIGHAQPAKPIPRIGYLLSVPLAEIPSPERAAFIDGLRQLGYVDRQTIVIEYRSAGGNFELLEDVAAELVKLNVDLIAATGFQATLAAKNTTKTVPIVMIAVGDPVGAGLVENLAKPGGNVTGLTLSFPELGGKRVELLKEAVPKLTRVAVVWNSQNAANIAEWKVMQSAARALGVALESFSVRQSSDLLNAFTAIPRYRPGGLGTNSRLADRALSPAHREVCAGAADPVDPLAPGLCRVRGPHELRAEPPRDLPSCRDVRGQAPERSQARRPADRAAHEIRARDQSQGRPRAQSRDPADAPASSRSGHRVGLRKGAREGL
jgi:ABC transporter substrate binding protein